MFSEGVFLDVSLPKVLKKEELNDLFKKMQLGNKEARKKIIVHNIRLVLYIVTKFNNINYDKSELVSIGNIGLIKAVDTFDYTRNINFATYASKCITIEILLFLRKLKKDNILESLEDIVVSGKKDCDLLLKDQLVDDYDMIEECINTMLSKQIINILNNYPYREREMVKMYFGFYDRTYKLKEIALLFKINCSNVSRIIKKVVTEIGDYLEVNENNNKSLK